MRFADFAGSLEALEATSGRIEMYRLLGGLFERAAPEEVAPIAYLCEGRLLPAFEGVETGMGERGVAVAIAAATRCAAEDVAGASARLGDLGLVAEELIPPTRRPRLSLTEVYGGLLRLARTTGKGSTEEKQRQLAALLGRATRREARYLVRLTLGRLRPR
jgi:DNA ligase 1